MRRIKQLLPHNESLRILREASSGVLSLIDPNGRPYGVPMSFVFDGEKHIYFHCAPSGRKIECIENNPFCCFTVICRDDVRPEQFTTYFTSVIAQGTVSIISNKDEIARPLRLLSAKYSPGIDCEPEIDKGIHRVLVLKMAIDSISGKEAIELTKLRNTL